MRRRLLFIGFALFIALAPASAQASPSDFGVEEVTAGLSSAQAGAHPDFTVGFKLATDSSSPANPLGLHKPFAKTRDLDIGLPPGLIGNPNVVAQCTAVQFSSGLEGGGCPQDSQIGISIIELYGFSNPLHEPVFNMTPPSEGAVARLGVYAGPIPVFINVQVRSEGDYGLDSTIQGASTLEELVSAKTTIWGVPASPVHDTQRLTIFEAFTGAPASPPRKSGLSTELPFLSSPTHCGEELKVSVEADSYSEPGRFSRRETSLPALNGCGKLRFEPEFSVTPTTHEAASPSGLDVDLSIPQGETLSDLATAQLRDAEVIFPAGMTIAAGAAEGLQACSAEQVGFGKRTASACPPAAKIGTAEFDVPELSRKIEGAIYQRTPESGDLFRVWLTSDELGAHVKIAGDIRLDPNTGQVSSLFLDNPQVPLRDLELHIFGGSHGPLATPAKCGTYFTHFSFTPWSGTPSASGDTPMSINSGCGTGGFAPTLAAGSGNPSAGSFSPFVLRLDLPSGNQNLSGLKMTLPKGLSAKLAGVAVCEGAAAASGECPPESRIGSATVASGPGPAPLWLPQAGKPEITIYLAGPYKGAPYSLVVKAPAQAGPFDLGTVVVRGALFVDPESAQVTFVSDPLPQFLQGVPISYRTIEAVTSRPNFTLNPTSCEPAAVKGVASSVAGASASLSSRFQVGGCRGLGFKPQLHLRLLGGTKRGDNPRFRAELKVRPGDANIAKVVVALPHSEFLEQAHIRTICTRMQFAEGTCPPGSVYGYAKVKTPLLDEPLQGPVFLRSSSHPLPDLVIALSGRLNIDLVGRIDSVHGGIRTSFESAPDAPVESVVLNMRGGQKSLLANSRNICTSTGRARVSFVGQNGKTSALDKPLQNSCAHKK